MSEARIIPLSTNIQCRIEVDDLQNKIPESELRRAARKYLRAYAESFGEDVLIEAVTPTRKVEVAGVFRTAHEYRWMPGPEAPCEFIGGQLDGERLDLPRESDLLPPRLWRLPRALDMAIDFRHSEEIAPMESFAIDYKLIGFRPHEAIWIYEWRP